MSRGGKTGAAAGQDVLAVEVLHDRRGDGHGLVGHDGHRDLGAGQLLFEDLADARPRQVGVFPARTPYPIR